MVQLAYIFIFIACFFSSTFALPINDLKSIRKEFNLAINDEQKAIVLFDELTKLNPASNSIQYAYLGATEALLAKHAFNPFSKLNYVNAALNKLNKSVELNADNIEIRYMRFSVESQMPSYLGYSEHIDEDKHSLIQGLTQANIQTDNCKMYEVFAQGIIKSNYCNNEEKTLLSNIVTRCAQVKHN